MVLFWSVLVVLMPVLLLATAEVALRVLSPGPAPGSDALAYAHDPVARIRLKPNMRKRYTRAPQNGGQTIEWRTNAQGYRGEALRKDHGPRVVVYGDSNVQARFSRLADSFPQRIAHYLRAAGVERPEVINAGVAGEGPDQSLLRFERDAASLAPDAVIFHVFADNDFGDIVRNRLFEIDASGALVRTDYDPGVDFYLRRQQARKTAGALRIVQAARTLLGLDAAPAEALAPHEAAQQPPARVDAAEWIEQVQALSAHQYSVFASHGAARFSHFADHYDIDVASDPDSESARAKRALMQGVLRRANAFAEAHGILFLVVVLPSVNDMTRTRGALSFEDLARLPGYRRQNLSSAVSDACRRAGIAVIDLFDVFDAHDPEQLYFADPNDHWNDAGQDLAARHAASWLTAKLGSPTRAH